jgi:exodeoxyribonuclease V alpha subunit
MQAQTQETSFVGELLFLKVYPSGWGMGKIKSGTTKIAVNGNALNGLKESTTYEFFGREVDDPKWGKQIKISRVSVHIPQDRSALARYLHKNYAGVGEKTAQKFIDFHLSRGLDMAQLREQILNNPFAVDFSCVSKRKTQSKDKGGVRDAIYRVLASKLGGLDTSDAMFRALASYYEKRFEARDDPVGDAWSEFTRNPYLPIREVSGYGFLRADVLGRRLGYPRDAAPRLAALVTHSIDEGCTTNGHTFLTFSNFEEKINLIDASVDVQSAIVAAVELGEPIVVENGRHYIRKYYDAERGLRTLLGARALAGAAPLLNRPHALVADAVNRAAGKIGLKLDDSQLKAVVGILMSNTSVHTITAGPGCGKTAIMEVVTSLLIDYYKIGFCAPTGKAAKVLNSRVQKIGASASTIHSLLGVTERGFVHHSGNLLPFDLLVVDETSMVDVSLMNSLVSALNERCHIVFLGDDKQLPSVGPGNVLADVLRMDFDHHRLTKTHRNHGGILEVVSMAGAGSFDFAQRDDVYFFDGLPDASESSIADVLDIYEQDLQAVGGDFSQVGLLIARRKGDPKTPGWNVNYLNHRMRERYNPNSAKVPGSFLCVNDRIIIRKNIAISYPNPDPSIPENIVHSVVNGDTGYINSYLVKSGASNDDDIGEGMVEWVVLELDDGRILQYPSKEMGSLDLSYAMTVHSAQGSEYQRLICICVNGSPSFIHRGILFTAWSRAQKNLTIIGNRDAISSILKRPTPKRNSNLVL